MFFARVNALFKKNAKHDDDIVCGKRLGRGAFAEVFRCEYKGEKCACKIIKLNLLSKNDLKLLENEIAIWLQLRHENVCALMHVQRNDALCKLVCEMMQESLRHRHVRMVKLGAKPRMLTLVRGWIQMTTALSYLHGLAFMHRDVKTDNILVTDEPGRDTLYKLTDFGLAKAFCKSDDHTAETGSYRFMSPEVIRHERYDSKCDIYSLALVYYETLTLNAPFESLSPVEVAMSVATRAARPPLPPLPVAVRSLIESAWSQSAPERPSADELLKRLFEILEMNVSFSSLEMSAKLIRR